MSEQEPGNNADETLLRRDSDGVGRLDKGPMTPNQSAHDDETVIRGSMRCFAMAHPDDETVIRQDTARPRNIEENQQVAGSDDATIIRGAEADSSGDRMMRPFIRSEARQDIASDDARPSDTRC